MSDPQNSFVSDCFRGLKILTQRVSSKPLALGLTALTVLLVPFISIPIILVVAYMLAQDNPQ